MSKADALKLFCVSFTGRVQPINFFLFAADEKDAWDVCLEEMGQFIQIVRDNGDVVIREVEPRRGLVEKSMRSCHASDKEVGGDHATEP